MTFYVDVNCSVCKTTFGMPRELYNVLQAGAGKLTWYCPYGHPRTFVQGETDEDKLRRERDRLTQKLAEKDDEIRSAWASANQQAEWRKAGERKLSAAKGQITKIKKRVHQGVCPCCNRQFANLQFHMHAKHPGYVDQPTADEAVH